MQRLYYLSRGHRHLSLSYRPRTAMEAFLADEAGARCSSHAFTTKHDGTAVSYRRIGVGPKAVLLLNGVGTDFHMWLRPLRFMHQQSTDLFQQVSRDLALCPSNPPTVQWVIICIQVTQ